MAHPSDYTGLNVDKLRDTLKAWLRRAGGLARHRDEGSFVSDTRIVTVLFSNIRDWVPLCERLELQQVGELINAYFTEMGKVVVKYNGAIESPDHALEAVQTALELQERTRDFSRRWEARVGGAIRCGVGISTGYAVVGNVGTAKHPNYTAIGDTVSLAQRLESLTKEYEVPIVISETTHQHLAGRIPTRELGDVVPKGMTRAVKCFAVLG